MYNWSLTFEHLRVPPKIPTGFHIVKLTGYFLKLKTVPYKVLLQFKKKTDFQTNIKNMNKIVIL